MAMTVSEVKEVLTEVLDKLKKSVEKESTYLKELDDDKAVLTYITDLKEKGEELPLDCAYASFNEWIESIEKEIKNDQTSVNRISIEKAEIVAFEYFMENASDSE